MVGYPYTKTMVAVMDVDMAASVVVASWAAADRLGVPDDRRVPLRGWCYATDATYVAEHPDLSRSPAMAAASAEALRVAGVGIDDIAPPRPLLVLRILGRLRPRCPGPRRRTTPGR